MRKLTSVLLILLLAMSLFAGCSKTEPVVEEPAAEEATEAVEEATEEATTEEVDVVTTASIVTDADAFVSALGADGAWIAAALNDITLDADLVVEGEFMNKEVVARKIALYTQDEDHNVIDRFTLTAPKMIVKSENLKLQGGTFVGDVYVEANGFKVSDATVEGNIIFASQEYKDSFVLDAEKESTVTGTMEVE